MASTSRPDPHSTANYREEYMEMSSHTLVSTYLVTAAETFGLIKFLWLENSIALIHKNIQNFKYTPQKIQIQLKTTSHSLSFTQVVLTCKAELPPLSSTSRLAPSSPRTIRHSATPVTIDFFSSSSILFKLAQYLTAQ